MYILHNSESGLSEMKVIIKNKIITNVCVFSGDSHHHQCRELWTAHQLQLSEVQIAQHSRWKTFLYFPLTWARFRVWIPRAPGAVLWVFAPVWVLSGHDCSFPESKSNTHWGHRRKFEREFMLLTSCLPERTRRDKLCTLAVVVNDLSESGFNYHHSYGLCETLLGRIFKAQILTARPNRAAICRTRTVLFFNSRCVHAFILQASVDREHLPQLSNKRNWIEAAVNNCQGMFVGVGWVSETTLWLMMGNGFKKKDLFYSFLTFFFPNWSENTNWISYFTIHWLCVKVHLLLKLLLATYFLIELLATVRSKWCLHSVFIRLDLMELIFVNKWFSLLVQLILKRLTWLPFICIRSVGSRGCNWH